jgi:hypothetical protein
MARVVDAASGETVGGRLSGSATKAGNSFVGKSILSSRNRQAGGYLEKRQI